MIASSLPIVTPIPPSASPVTNVAGNARDVNLSAVPSNGGFNFNGLLDPTSSVLLMSGQTAPLLPVQSPTHPIAEFLYQLTKMLSDDNRDVIEWLGGRIQVHDPERLASDVLHKYFRHSNYASFQRQLNYFGFRKIAGKGKMSPCAYENDSATNDLRSLLYIKRKTSRSTSRKPTPSNRRATGAQNRVDNNESYNKDVHMNMNKRKMGEDFTSEFEEPPKKQVPFQDKSAVADNDASIQEQNKETTPNLAALPQSLSALTRAHAPLSECMHFPSENTLALLTCKPNITTSMPQVMKQAVDQILLGNSNTLATIPQNIGSGMACPATAAMNAAAATQNNSLFDSAPQLSALLGNQSATTPSGRPSGAAIAQYPSALHLLGTVSSSSSLLPENFSSASLGQMTKNNSGQFPSLLNFSSFLSRESSLADLVSPFAASSVGAQLAAHGLSLEPTPLKEIDPEEVVRKYRSQKLGEHGNQFKNRFE